MDNSKKKGLAFALEKSKPHIEIKETAKSETAETPAMQASEKKSGTEMPISKDKKAAKSISDDAILAKKLAQNKVSKKSVISHLKNDIKESAKDLE